MNRALRTALSTATATLLATATLSSCSLVGGGDDDEGGSTVTLVTHSSFNLPKELIEQFEEDSGHQLKVKAAGDGGTLTNELALNRNNPTGDVAFGVDNTFASRAIEEKVFEAYEPELPAGAESLRIQGEGAEMMVPVDHGSVCVNVDLDWFAEKDLKAPKRLADLTEPAYKDLFVIPGASTSTPGMAFLLATIAEYGDQWPAYWKKLMANGAKLTQGWSDAYEGDFTGASDKGKRPIVVSYDTSPAFTVTDDGTTTTAALLDTCFEQVEYAGVLANADNPEGARALIDFLLSEDVQKALPDSMYVFPVDDSVALPEAWEKFAEQPSDPYTVPPAEIAENRSAWLSEWTDITSR
ncbi:thiamine transport system substrate-binding protein [Nocardioides daedukensis]|uniref:Thiamine transport system substrate-binding protein n=1 Tax=Nocardioides daedukensis TaxID=634462 RepID=A0A7Y9UNV5_9ACTN|nr:thiamine ABC transporter substrate-binding protein [Nocardioides daedukensis]NYG58948.1 thiamine transport system substrate-binding protein [Nocardioides daedukensis]